MMMMMMTECKIDTSNNRDNWNKIKIIQYLSNILGKQEFKELRKKTAILRTAHMLQKVLM